MPRGRRRSRRRTLRRIVALLLVFLLAGVLLIVAAYSISISTPAWWHPPDPRHKGVAERAESLESLIADELSRADRPGTLADTGRWSSEPWTLRVTDLEASSWLNARLARWAENRIEDFHWPSEFESLQVSFTRGSVRVGVRVRLRDASRVFWAELAPEVRDDSSIWLRRGWIYAGNLPLPAAMLARMGTAALTTDAPRQLISALLGDAPLLREPVIRLGDGRSVRVRAIELRPGEVILTCTTEFEPP